VEGQGEIIENNGLAAGIQDLLTLSVRHRVRRRLRCSSLSVRRREAEGARGGSATGLAAGLVCAMSPGPLLAECTGGGCYDGIAAFLISVALYGLIGSVLLVMIAVGKWRRAGLRGLALVAALAIGVPLLSLGWQRVQLWWMERGEVLGVLPRMSERTPLLIAEDWTCESGLCAAVLQGQGAAGVMAVPIEALEGLDPASDLVLADLPLEQWFRRPDGILQRRTLGEAERAEAARDIDYLILSQVTWYGSTSGALERGLDLGEGALLRLAMAPLDKGSGRVSLRELDYDYRDLVLTRAALGIPLAPGNWTTVWNDALAPDAVAQSLCGVAGAEPDWACSDAAWR
jgi:hypothetical protein